MSREVAKKLSEQLYELPGSSKSNTCVTIDSQDEHNKNVDWASYRADKSNLTIKINNSHLFLKI